MFKFIASYIKYILWRPFTFTRELVADNRSGLVSASKTAFVVALVTSTIFFAKIAGVLVGQLMVNPQNPSLPSLLSFVRDYVVIYLGTFAATSLGSKFIRSWRSGSKTESDDEPADREIPPVTDATAVSKKTIDMDDGDQ